MQAVAVRAKELRYAVDLTPAGELTDENGVVLDVPGEWSPEHLLLAALVRCSLKSLRHHADAQGRRRALGLRQQPDARDASARPTTATHSSRPTVELAVEIAPEPEPAALAELLALAERDCFVGSSLTAKPSYRWVVNGRTIDP